MLLFGVVSSVSEASLALRMSSALSAISCRIRSTLFLSKRGGSSCKFGMSEGKMVGKRLGSSDPQGPGGAEAGLRGRLERRMATGVLPSGLSPADLTAVAR